MELPSDVGLLKQMILDLMQIIEGQSLRIKELEAKVKESSKNSHRPPSSDGYRKANALPKEKKSQGGQKGHKGETLKMVSVADETEPCYAQVCSCGYVVGEVKQELLSRRQVFDLPEPKLIVKEYQQYGCQCPGCGTRCRGEFPQGVTAPVQYGYKAKALGVLLTQGYCLSLEKTSELFKDLFGYPISEQTLLQAQASAYDQLDSSEAVIRQKLEQSPVVHADETGMRVGGKLQWLHTASTDKWTHLYVHAKRGTAAFESDQAILGRLNRWLVHDCWGSYFKLDKVQHALCGAHLLRELQAQIDCKSQWAAQMHAFLLQLYNQRNQQTEVWPLKPVILDRFDAICQLAEQEEPPAEQKQGKGKRKRTKGRNLFERMRTHQHAVLAFSFHPEVPFTNNQAERDIRPLKVKQKVSGCFRTSTGAIHFARIQSFLSTARKHGKSAFQELCNAFVGPTFISTCLPT